MHATLEPVELVGGPLCGVTINIDFDDINKVQEVPYYGGIAIYRIQENGKGWYIGG